MILQESPSTYAVICSWPAEEKVVYLGSENLTNDASLVFDNHGATENLHFLQDF